MLSLKDCLDFCDLECREIEAIAEHEHVPLMLAIEMGNQLMGSDDGLRQVHQMMREDIEHALQEGHMEHASELTATYLHFRRLHPLPEAA